MSGRLGKKPAAASEKDRLAAENRAMEQRLAELKNSLQKQREQRAQVDSNWESGRKGTLAQHTALVLQQNHARRITSKTTFRVLNGDEEIKSATSSPSATKGKAVSQPPSTQPHATSGLLLDGEFDEEAQRAEFAAAVNEWHNPGRTMSEAAPLIKNNNTSAGGALLSGPAFDEQESEASFQNALSAWRRGESMPVEKPTVDLNLWRPTAAPSTTEIQTDTTQTAQPVTIAFQTESNLSFMEKLMLKRSRMGATKSVPSSRVDSAATTAPHGTLDDGVYDGYYAEGAGLLGLIDDPEFASGNAFNFVIPGSRPQTSTHKAASASAQPKADNYDIEEVLDDDQPGAEDLAQYVVQEPGEQAVSVPATPIKSERVYADVVDVTEGVVVSASPQTPLHQSIDFDTEPAIKEPSVTNTPDTDLPRPPLDLVTAVITIQCAFRIFKAHKELFKRKEEAHVQSQSASAQKLAAEMVQQALASAPVTPSRVAAPLPVPHMARATPLSTAQSVSRLESAANDNVDIEAVEAADDE